MPDIFGRERHDYSHIRALDATGEGVWERHQNGLALMRGSDIPHHDFNALGMSGADAQRMALPTTVQPQYRALAERAEPNAQAIGYVTNNLLAIQGMVDEVLYTEHRLPEFVPLNTMIPEGAETYGVVVEDYVGEGDYISNDGTDAPNATASQRIVPHGLDYAGIDAEWTVEDIRNAMFGGFPLADRALRAAVRGAQNHMERVGLVGHTGRNYKGLTKLPTAGRQKVTHSARAVNQTFKEIDAEEVRDQINEAIGKVIEDTDEVFGRTITDGMTVFLPVAQFNYVSSKRVGDNLDKTILASLREDNPWTARTGNPVRFKSLIELKGAGSNIGGNPSDRMIVTIQDTRIYEMGVSIMPRVLRIMDKGRVICAQVEYKFGSLFTKRPSVIFYFDGV